MAVSYTHLDVYKRQAHLIRKGMYFVIRMKEISSNGILSAYDSVSYTHLDVYKRQDMTVENTSASQIAPVRQDRIRNPFSF